jgi:hypothetical protein
MINIIFVILYISHLKDFNNCFEDNVLNLIFPEN